MRYRQLMWQEESNNAKAVAWKMSVKPNRISG
jgi:hypothetical protein